MYYYKDPIFSHFNEATRKPLFHNHVAANRSLSNGAKIEVMWSDGFDYNKLETLKDTKTVLLTNIVIENAEAFAKHLHRTNQSYFGYMHCNYQVDPYTPITHNFNCFMNRYDAIRQSWLYQLIRRKYFDSGHVSFKSEVGPGRVPSNDFDGLTPAQAFEHGFHKFNHIFAQEHKTIKDQIPLCTFEDTGDLTNLVLSSKFSLILETWFHDNRMITFSEKIMRGLQLPRPWLVFSTQYAVKQLREWGFDVLDDIVDHSYDTIADTIQRQVKILDIMQPMMDLNVPLVTDRCVQASNHNQSILKTWHENWAVNMSKDLEIARQKALAL